jgi:hypothetical protein
MGIPIWANHLGETMISTFGGSVNFKIQFEREEDDRWIAEISELPGVMAYGATQAEAEAAVEALAPASDRGPD